MSETNSEKTTKKPRKVKPIGADGHRQRMFRRFFDAGENHFPPRDLLELLLFYPIKMRDTRDSAVYLMQSYNNDVEAVINGIPADLCKADGIGPSSALFLNIVGENVRRLKIPPKPPEFNDIDRLPELFNEKCKVMCNEELWALYFDHYGVFICSRKLDCGFLLQDKINVIDLLCGTISSTAYIWVARYSHNHNLYPTNADIAAYKKLRQCMEYSRTVLLDYHIITPRGSFSPAKFDFSKLDL